MNNVYKQTTKTYLEFIKLIRKRQFWNYVFRIIIDFKKKISNISYLVIVLLSEIKYVFVIVKSVK